MSVQVLIGDCREVLKGLPDGCVNACVTSPPYFGLRDYGTGTWEGGAAGCEHTVGGQVADSKAPGAIVSGVRPGADASTCRRCGARRVDAQIGLEATPAAFVAELVAVFREVRRVLRDDGTLWLNLGDSYAGSWGAQGHRESPETLSRNSINNHPKKASQTGTIQEAGLKPKDLIGIPWRVAFALQADGWYLRQDIIWAKPNPMPESVTDRCTKAHEYLFLLSKAERYHFDAAAIAEPAINAGRVIAYDGDQKNVTAALDPKMRTRISASIRVGETRNKRSVWNVATTSFAEAHFATFPPDLVEPCIAAGCPKGGVVLDPFGGAGTTGLVADRMGRHAVLIELNPAYAGIAQRRMSKDGGLFADIAVGAG